MLEKIILGINFTKSLRAAFLVVSVLCIFLCLQFALVILWQNEIGAKAAHNMLVTLILGINVTNI